MPDVYYMYYKFLVIDSVSVVFATFTLTGRFRV